MSWYMLYIVKVHFVFAGYIYLLLVYSSKELTHNFDWLLFYATDMVLYEVFINLDTTHYNLSKFWSKNDALRFCET